MGRHTSHGSTLGSNFAELSMQAKLQASKKIYTQPFHITTQLVFWQDVQRLDLTAPGVRLKATKTLMP